MDLKTAGAMDLKTAGGTPARVDLPRVEVAPTRVRV